MLDYTQYELSEEVLLFDLRIFITIQLLFGDVSLMKYHTTAENWAVILKSQRLVHGLDDVFLQSLEIESHQAEVGDLLGYVVGHYEEV